MTFRYRPARARSMQDAMPCAYDRMQSAIALNAVAHCRASMADCRRLGQPVRPWLALAYRNLASARDRRAMATHNGHKLP